jgi:hypothetical protein
MDASPLRFAMNPPQQGIVTDGLHFLSGVHAMGCLATTKHPQSDWRLSNGIYLSLNKKRFPISS